MNTYRITVIENWTVPCFYIVDANTPDQAEHKYDIGEATYDGFKSVAGNVCNIEQISLEN